MAATLKSYGARERAAAQQFVPPKNSESGQTDGYEEEGELLLVPVMNRVHTHY